MQILSTSTDNSLHHLHSTAEQAQQYFDTSISESTRKAHRIDWKVFSEFCDTYRLENLPAAPETVVLFITDQAESKAVATIQRRLASISAIHRQTGLDTPTSSQKVRKVLEGIKRSKGVEQKQAKAISRS